MTEPDRPSADWVSHVIQANGRDLLGYFIRRVSNPDAAADLLGSLFVVVWRRRDSLPTDPERARKWCFGIARNILREHRRGHARQIALADTLRAHLEITAQRYTADPAHTAEQREQSAGLHTAIRRLDWRSQELITLIHWDEFSITDAAEHLGMNPSSARTKYARARATLAHLLGDDAPRQAVRTVCDEGVYGVEATLHARVATNRKLS
jgi:RNA polymerase sigma-70 factor (ECF subfamily)